MSRALLRQRSRIGYPDGAVSGPASADIGILYTSILVVNQGNEHSIALLKFHVSPEAKAERRFRPNASRRLSFGLLPMRLCRPAVDAAPERHHAMIFSRSALKAEKPNSNRYTLPVSPCVPSLPLRALSMKNAISGQKSMTMANAQIPPTSQLDQKIEMFPCDRSMDCRNELSAMSPSTSASTSGASG